MKLASLGFLAVLTAGCGGDDEHLPDARVDGAVDAITTDAPDLDAPDLDAGIDGAPIDGSSIDAPAALNDCTRQGAINLTGPGANRTIVFGGATGLAYDPPCIRVAAGQSVTWSGDLTAHPLRGGTVVNSSTTVDPQSPIPPTDTGTTATVQFSSTGDFGFFCNVHGSTGMYGAVFVDP